MANYLLFFPSLITDNSKYGEYGVDNWETKYEGLQTNEPITKYLIHYLAEKGQSMKQIIMLSTKAVREHKLEKVGGLTTLDYYKQNIMDYIDKNGYRHLYNLPEEQLFRVIEVKEEEGESIEKILDPLKQIIQMTTEDEKIEKNHIYVDFTGGLRTAALMMLFACRILQSYDGVVEKILYSNLGEKRIIECTKTYYCFDYLAAQVEQKYNGIEQTLEYLRRELDADEEVNQFLEMLRQFTYDKKSNNVENAGEKAEKLLEGIARVSERTEDKTFANQMLEAFTRNISDLVGSKSGVLYLLEEVLEKKNYDQALRLFREQGIDILIDLKLLQIKKSFLAEKKNRQCLVDTMIGIYNYYESIPKKNDKEEGKKQEKIRYTFMDRMEVFMNLLAEEKEKEPVYIKEEFEKKYCSLITYSGIIPERGFRDSKYSRMQCQIKIKPYIEKMAKEGKSLIECIEEYDKLERIYLGVGYPFLCTYKDNIIKGYDRLYKEQVFDRGVYSLQKLYHGMADNRIIEVLKKLQISKDVVSKITYKEFLGIYVERKQEVCRLLFPFVVSEEDFTSDILKKREFSRFMYQFLKMFCNAKDVRNRLVHKSATEEEVEEVTGELRQILECMKEVLREKNLEKSMEKYYER